VNGDEDIRPFVSLRQNFPNPFNPSTVILFSIQSPGFVVLSIYNVLGQKVKTLLEGYSVAGEHTVVWDGDIENGDRASAGIYLYRLKYENRVLTRKMILVDQGRRQSGSPGNTIIKSEKSVQENIKKYTIMITGGDLVVYKSEGVVIPFDRMLNFTVQRFPEGLVLVTIPGGTFRMGDVEGIGQDIESPVHTVTLDDYEMGAHEITHAEYTAYLNEAFPAGDIIISGNSIMGKTGPYAGKEYMNLIAGDNGIFYSQGKFTFPIRLERFPVSNITWYGAKACALFYGCDLPSEAEWEYACRGGKQYLYGTNDGTISEKNANFNMEYGFKDVESFPPNPFGLYDMSGSVREWCNDFQAFYTDLDGINPRGPDKGNFCVFRGGGMYDDAYQCRAAMRFFEHPDHYYFARGFRIVRRPDGITY
jgi:formylglycine-generating enzyme required for sulfatase activity